jgi:hypothetical protein
MSTITWRGGSSGDWATPTNWTGFAVPQAGDDVVIGSGITVTIDTPGVAADAISLGAGASLLVVSTLDLGGALGGGTLALAGDLIGAGTLESPLDGLGGTIDGVDVAYGQGIGGVTITPATGAASTAYPIQVAGTLTLASGSYGGAFAVGTFPTAFDGENWYDLAVAGSVTLAAQANVVLGHLDGVTYVGPALIGATGSDTLTNQGTISGGSAYGATISPAGFVNSGTVAITLGEYYGGLIPTALQIDSIDFSNTGLLSNFGGSVTLDSATVDNAGDIALTGGYPPTQDQYFSAGSVFVADTVSSFLNTGTITAAGIGFAGYVTLPDLGTLQGGVTIYGELNLLGGTLDAGAYGAGITVTGTIRDGTLTANGGTLTLRSATLYDTTVASSANVVATGPITLIDPPDGSSVTLDGTTTELNFTGGNIENSLTITAGNAFVNDTIDVAAGSATLGAGSAITQVAGLVQILGDGTLEDDGGIAVEAGTLAVSALLTGRYFVALAPGATMIVSGTLGGDGTIALTEGAAVTIDALAAAAAPTISFSTNAELAVLPGSGAGVTLSGLQAGDLIDFAGLSATGGGVARAQLIGGTLEVVAASGQTASLAADDATPGLSFSVIGDGSGGTLVQAVAGPTALTADTSFDNTPGVDYGTYALDGGPVTAGDVTVEGSYTVELLAGALWQTGALSMGQPIANTVPPFLTGSGILTIDGGVADGGTLEVGGEIILGGTYNPDANSYGSLTAIDGISVIASGLSMDFSNVAVDATSSMVLGVATATQGALTVAAGTTFDVTDGAVFGNLIDSGDVEIQMYEAIGAVPGSLSVSGNFTLDSTLTVSNYSLLVVGGTLLMQNGASLTVQDHTDIAGPWAVAGNATVVLQAAAWQTGALAVGVGNVPGTLAVQGTFGADLAVDGAITLGGIAGAGAIVATGVAITAASLSLSGDSTVSLDAASSLLLGSGAATTGALTIGQGGALTADSGTLDGSVIDSGTLVVNGTLTVADTLIVAPGGSLTLGVGRTLIAGALRGSISLAAGSASIGAIDGQATIDAGYGALQLGGATLSGLLVDDITDSVDLTGVAFSSTFPEDARAVSIAGAQFDIAPSDAGPTQQPALFTRSDGHGGTLIYTEVPCYAAGTRILAECGEVPVESLRPGERVRTASGRLAPVLWVGRTRVDLACHPQPERAAPVRVVANAIAPGIPRRDLLLSRDHALYLDGALVPVWQLANGASIARQDGLESITYFHVELDRHDIILAEGMAAESYLDTGNRGLFANAAGVRPLHADFGAAPGASALRIWAQQAAAPLLLGGDAVAALRSRLLARALALGWARSHHPALTVVTQSAVLPMRRAAADWRVRVPARAASLRLHSHSFVPAERTRDSGDARRLGVAVASLRYGGSTLTAKCLRAGWHAPDGPDAVWRWTDGDAVVVLPPLPRSATLEIRLVCADSYWTPPARAQYPGGRMAAERRGRLHCRNT